MPITYRVLRTGSFCMACTMQPAQVDPKCPKHHAQPIMSADTVLGLSGTSLFPQDTKMGLTMPKHPPRRINKNVVEKNEREEGRRKP